MNRVFEVLRRTSHKTALLLIVAVVIYAILCAFLDTTWTLVVILPSFILGFIYIFVFRKDIKRVRVELSKEKMAFGEKSIPLCDVKRIDLLKNDLVITYGNNTTHRYLLINGSRQTVSEFLRVYSGENNVSYYDAVRASIGDEMVFDYSQFTNYYIKKHYLIIDSLRSRLLDMLTLIPVFSLILVVLVVLEEYPRLGTVLALCLSIVFYLFYFLKFRRNLRKKIRERCEMQRQYFEGENLKVVLFGKKNAIEKYCVQKQKVNKVLVTDHYIEVYGDVDCEIHSSEGIDKKVVECVKIPRCFTKEGKIASFGRK